MTRWASPPKGASPTDRAIALFATGRPTPCAAMSIADTKASTNIDGTKSLAEEHWSGTMDGDVLQVKDVKRGSQVWLQLWNKTQLMQVSQLTVYSKEGVDWFVEAAKKFISGGIDKTGLEVSKRSFLKAQAAAAAAVAKKPAAQVAKKPAAKVAPKKKRSWGSPTRNQMIMMMMMLMRLMRLMRLK